MLKKAVSGEGTTLMRLAGEGEVFLADQAQEIHLLYLEDDFITVNGRSLLAFDADIDWDIKRVSGGASAMMAGGLFNMELRGTGWVAILSDGPPVLLNVAEAATFADAQAAITWSSGVTTAIKTDFKMKNLIGRARARRSRWPSAGQGWLLVQPSEGASAAAAGSRASDVDELVVAGLVHRRLAARAPPARLQRRAARGVAQRLACPPVRAPQSASSRSAPASSRPLAVARRRSAAGARSRARDDQRVLGEELQPPLSTFGAIPSSSSWSSLKRFSPSSSAATTSSVQRSPTRASASASGEAGGCERMRRRRWERSRSADCRRVVRSLAICKSLWRSRHGFSMSWRLAVVAPRSGSAPRLRARARLGPRLWRGDRAGPRAHQRARAARGRGRCNGRRRGGRARPGGRRGPRP